MAGLLAQHREHVADATQELVKAEDRTRRQLIVAPDAGIVTQLSIVTVGGVVQTGEVLMRLVPTGGALEASVTVPNKDVGFVAEDQPAVVKIDAFNYLRYGTLEGRVVKLSADAVDARATAEGGAAVGAAQANPQAPPSCTATIALKRDTITVDGRGAADPGDDGDGRHPHRRATGGGVPAAAGAAVCGGGVEGEMMVMFEASRNEGATGFPSTVGDNQSAERCIGSRAWKEECRVFQMNRIDGVSFK